jgi:hypothetical protein
VATPVEAVTGRGEISGGWGFHVAPAECVAPWTKKSSAPSIARGTLLDHSVEDDGPITHELSLRELGAAMAWQMPDTMLLNTLHEKPVFGYWRELETLRDESVYRARHAS